MAVDESDAPNDLEPVERLEWMKRAPYALGNGTLTPASAEAFNRFCRNVVLERRYAQSPTEAGGSNHRGIQQRIEVAEMLFGLSATGKPQAAAAPAVDVLKDKYFASSSHGP